MKLREELDLKNEHTFNSIDLFLMNVLDNDIDKLKERLKEINKMRQKYSDQEYNLLERIDAIFKEINDNKQLRYHIEDIIFNKQIEYVLNWVDILSKQMNIEYPSNLKHHSTRKDFNLLIRGEAFRTGGQFSRRTNGDVIDQQTAINSIIKYIINPLQKIYNLYIYIDIIISSQQKHKLIKEFFSNIQNIQSITIHSEVLKFQVETILRSMKHIKNTVSPTLIIRIDTIFKKELSFSKLDLDSFYVPFKGLHKIRVSDQIMLIPRNQMKLFIKAIRIYDEHLHMVYASLINLDFDKKRLKFFVKGRYDSNPAHWANPIYYFIGRKQSKRLLKQK